MHSANDAGDISHSRRYACIHTRVRRGEEPMLVLIFDDVDIPEPGGEFIVSVEICTHGRRINLFFRILTPSPSPPSPLHQGTTLHDHHK